LESINLTYTQFIVLMALWERDNVSISYLAAQAGLSKATMTPLLKRLEQKELIQRQRLDGNDRQKNIVLTDQGRALSVQGEEAAEKAFCATGVSKEQAKEMINLCQRIISRESLPIE
jgi:DNA-binding MarR family transcriptional regulator